MKNWIVIGGIALAAVAFFLLYSAPQYEPKLSFEKMGLDYSGSAVRLQNNEDQPGQCTMYVQSGLESFELHSGIVPPGSVVARDVGVEIDSARVLCDWRDYDYDGCLNTTFELCDFFRSNPKTRQCIDNDISYQGFCAAFLTKDRHACSLIDRRHMRVLCHAYMESNVSLCEQLSGWERDWCFKDYAINHMEPQTCSRIKDENQSLQCYSIISKEVSACNGDTECVILVASLHHDASMCDLADDSAKCYRDVAEH